MTTVTGKRVILKNLQDEYLIPFTDQGGSGNPDNETIILNTDDELETIKVMDQGNNQPYAFREVTAEQYEAMKQAGTLDSHTYYNVPDVDGLIVDFNSKANKSLDNLDAAGQAIIDSKANISLDNLTAEGEKHFLNKTQVTNCITEIPQDIKLGLNNGTLTLKAGSKVYVPNGFEQDGTTPKFDVVTIENDITTSISSYLKTYMELYNVTNNTIASSPVSICYSGPTAPSSLVQGTIWYDTANNLVKRHDGTSWQSLVLSLPFNISSQNSIDQVFNGFGYIGSTIFALPGVKGLIPNGRNDDGTLNNIELELENATIFENTANYRADFYLFIRSNGTVSSYNKQVTYTYKYLIDRPQPASNTYIRCYVLETNKWYTSNNGQPYEEYQATVFSSLGTNDGNTNIRYLDNFNSAQILTYNNRAEISGWSMPSSKYIDLTLGASGSTYTAPGNGWYYFGGQGKTTADAILGLTNRTTGIGSTITRNLSGGTRRVYIPVNKGDIVEATYSGSYNAIGLQFIYNNGQV